MRRCMTCATFDRSSRYDDPEAAAAEGIWSRARACRLCGEVGFDLVPEPPPIHEGPS